MTLTADVATSNSNTQWRLRPVNFWIPDTRECGVQTELRRQYDLVSQHDEEDVMNFAEDQASDWWDNS